jgi:tetratricopeptide (TPR) repeat protein
MKKYIVLFVLVLLLGGCATSRYHEAEQYLENREYNNALRSYLKFLNPKKRGDRRFIAYDRMALTGIGKIYWHMQRYDEAVAVLDKVIERDPNFGNALFYKGLSLEGQGLEVEALKQYQRYKFVTPKDRYRQVMFSRMDWISRRKIARETNRAMQEETQADIESVPDKSVAVLYFMSMSDDQKWQPLRKGIAEMIISDLSQADDLKVVERLRLNYLLEELNLSETAVTEESIAPRLGKLFGVRNLVKGSFIVLPDLKMTLDAGVYRVGRPRTPDMANLEGSLSRLFQMEKELVLRILDNLGVELTLQQRDRVLRIPTENMDAFLAYCRGLDALDRYDYQSAYQFFESAVNLDPNFVMAHDRLITQTMWEATHHSNMVRVEREVSAYVRVKEKDTREPVEVKFAQTSVWNRLQWMGMYQNAGFLPGNETRESFQEADKMGAPVLPTLLSTPPPPPVREQ